MRRNRAASSYDDGGGVGSGFEDLFFARKNFFLPINPPNNQDRGFTVLISCTDIRHRNEIVFSVSLNLNKDAVDRLIKIPWRFRYIRRFRHRSHLESSSGSTTLYA